MMHAKDARALTEAQAAPIISAQVIESLHLIEGAAMKGHLAVTLPPIRYEARNRLRELGYVLTDDGLHWHAYWDRERKVAEQPPWAKPEPMPWWKRWWSDFLES